MITIFTDGASRGNPGPGGWGAIVVSDNTDNTEGRVLKVKELGGAEAETTNNRMEMSAVIGALRFVKDFSGQLTINTDSSYVINGATKWLAGWKRAGWITSQKEPVLNRDLWEEISKLIADFSGRAAPTKITWNYVGGHSGIAGNERCDEIATGFADGEKVALYEGPLENYGVDIMNVNFDADKRAQRSTSKSRSRAKAYSYLSMVGGVIERHQTWSECEARVKGVAGARYKKALDAAEEDRIIADWKAL